MELLAYIHEEFTYSEQAIATESDIPTDSIFESTFLDWLKKLTAKSAKLSLNVILASTTILIGLSSILTATAQSAPSSNVKYVQSLLEKNGFDPGAIDGVAGASTKNAIIRAQQSLGLTTDGVAGSRTITALEDGGSVTQVTPTTEIKSSTSASSAIMNLQKLLADRGFYKGVVDGMMGSQTRAAIMSAQKAYNLTADGVAGAQTLAALESDGNRASTVPVSSVSTTKSSEVLSLQNLLSKRGFYTGSVDGLMGSQTRSAIIAAQRNYGLVADGIAGSQTFAALESGSSSVNIAVRNREVISNPTTETKASDQNVLALQQLLSRRGFYNGAIDGIKGTRTSAAIASAQTAYGLTPDGIAGTQTIAALQRDVRPAPSVMVRPTSTVRPTSNQPVRQPISQSPVNPSVSQPVNTSVSQPVSQPVKASPPSANDGGVANAQNLLTDRGFYKGPITGFSGARTTEAIIAAQKAYGLPADGVLGAQTIAALEGGAPRQQIPAVNNIVTPAVNSTVRVVPQPQVSPQLTPQPRVTVSPQAAASPRTTPTPTVQTSPSVSPQAQPTPAQSTPAQSATPSVQTSASNAQVLELQRSLIKRGFYNGKADGVLNGETRNAIVRAQNFYTISPADGAPSNKLIDSLSKDPFISEGN